MENNNTINRITKGYKVFDKDLKCLGFQYEIGKEYDSSEETETCGGFPFFLTIDECSHSYRQSADNRICEVEASKLKADNVYDGLHVASHIRIIREIPKDEAMNKGNIGVCNTGFCNTGNRNTGDLNYGNQNKGDSNVGNQNTGNSNIGDFNYGYFNKGNLNTGFRNEGDYNIGIRNKGNYCVGVCCTEATPVFLFNKLSRYTLQDLHENGVYYDLLAGNLTDRVAALEGFDQKIWDEIYGKEKK